jgi:hypothetical protein
MHACSSYILYMKTIITVSEIHSNIKTVTNHFSAIKLKLEIFNSDILVYDILITDFYHFIILIWNYHIPVQILRLRKAVDICHTNIVSRRAKC